MRIISWNCNGKFRNKFTEISKFDADIYIIQECENPATTTSLQYKQFSANHVWKGDIQYKGLGVFAKSSISLKQIAWNDHLLRYFIPVKVNGSFTILAVWACDPYIKEYAVYQDIHFDKYDNRMIVIGDFNSNKIWDTKYASYRSHSAVTKRLAEKGLPSAYHITTGKIHGDEVTNTFYLHRKTDKPYHTDYCFIAPDRINNFSILDKHRDFWLQHSDHIPLLLDID